MHRKLLPCLTVLAVGCSSAPYSQTAHEVTVQRHANPFLQTREIEAWSLRVREDHNGDHWPEGTTLNVRFVQQQDGSRQHYLLLRTDRRTADRAPAIYDATRLQQKDLREHCTSATLVHDGQTAVLPVHSITVRALTTASQMPVAPTDTRPDPVETIVARNASNAFVLSTTALVHIEPALWRRLASTHSLTYEYCGQAANATDAELAALREVISQSAEMGTD